MTRWGGLTSLGETNDQVGGLTSLGETSDQVGAYLIRID